VAVSSIKNKNRLIVIFGIIGLVFFGLIFQLVRIMFVEAEDLKAEAEAQWTREFDLSAKRGDILDRNGNVLAHSSSIDTVYVNVKQVTDASYLSTQLSALLDMDYDVIYDRVTDMTKSQVWLKRQVDAEITEQIAKLNIPGVGFYTESKRYYTNEDLLTSILGITSIDGEGLEGIEALYNQALSGTEGKLIGETDRTGKAIPYGDSMYVAADNGDSVVLAVDEVIQMFLEASIEDAYNEQGAQNTQGIVMDPDTGEILAVASYPDFDLNNPPTDDADKFQELIRNKVFSDAYEPGSTFKAITAASVLDSGVMTTENTFTCVGYLNVGGQRIKCWRDYNPHGLESFAQAVQNSCNPAFMTMALNMGVDTFYQYIYDFGFGEKTEVDAIYENEGIVMSTKYVKDFDLARIGFGQSIAVTPLQLTTAFSAVINGGNLMRPILVKEIVDENGISVDEFEPVVRRQVISSETSATMREILQSVVDEGGGQNAAIDGYSVGGKTGTAQKYDDDGNIVDGKYISSFIGFAPVEEPELVVLILVDEPDGDVAYGSVVAAPYVKEVMESSLKYLGIPATKARQEVYATVPNIVGMTAGDAMTAIEAVGLSCLMDGTGTVIAQSPMPGNTLSDGAEVVVYMSIKSDSDFPIVVVPDLTGLTREEAEVVLAEVGLQIYVERDGETILSQNVAEGNEVEQGTIITVQMS